MNFERSVSSFYDRWHRHERGLGRDDGQILDFDMAPREDRLEAGAAPPPFESRLQALRELGSLRQAVDAAGEALPARTYLAAKLRGADAYLRALMGERIAFDEYLEATMGIRPAPADDAAIAAERAVLEQEFAARGVSFVAAGRQRYREVFGRTDLTGFEDELRRGARAWVDRVQARLERRGVTADYTVEVVCEDAYWTNWIDGSVESGVRLRVNTHPRSEYYLGSSVALAAHEIAGHALHVAMLRAAAAAGRLPRWALNFTVHSCEAFQMEGLAQAVLDLAPADDVFPELRLLDRHTVFRNEVVNRAQVELEAGRPVDEVLEWAVATCPLVSPVGIASDLRDRARPFYRGYVHVYAPSARLFRRAAALPDAARWKFFSRAYEVLMTPAELAAWLDTCATGGAAS